MTCSDPQTAVMITRYELGLLNDEERQRFEAHLLSCDVCYADFFDFTPVAGALQTHRRRFVQALAPEMTRWERINTRCRRWLQTAATVLAGRLGILTRPIVLWPAVAAVILFAVIKLAPEWQYTHLVELERYAAPSVFRGARELAEDDKLFQQAMDSYRRHEDSAAFALLGRVITLAPQNAGAQFFLGVSALHQNAVDAAIRHLERAIVLQDTIWEDESRWYLANAFLLKNQADSARLELQQVAAARGKFSGEAGKLLQEIDRIQQQPWWRRYRQTPVTK